MGRSLRKHDCAWYPLCLEVQSGQYVSVDHLQSIGCFLTPCVLDSRHSTTLAELQEESDHLRESHVMFSCTYTQNRCHIEARDRCMQRFNQKSDLSARWSSQNWCFLELWIKFPWTFVANLLYMDTEGGNGLYLIVKDVSLKNKVRRVSNIRCYEWSTAAVLLNIGDVIIKRPLDIFSQT